MVVAAAIGHPSLGTGVGSGLRVSSVGVYVVACSSSWGFLLASTSIAADGGCWGLFLRIKKHRYSIKRGDDNNAIYRHVLNKDHRIYWSNSQLLYKCNDLRKRRIRETICIEKYDNFNLCAGAFKLDPIMRSLVDK